MNFDKIFNCRQLDKHWFHDFVLLMGKSGFAVFQLKYFSIGRSFKNENT